MRLQSIQVLRGIAAIGVAIAHLQGVFDASGAPGAFPNFKLGAAGVDLFFVISGFVMVYASENLFGKPGSIAAFARSRLIRIVPMYWLATFSFLFIILVVMKRPLGYYDISSNMILPSLLFIPTVRPSGSILPVVALGWTLVLEMTFYAIFAAAIWLPRLLAVFLASSALLLLLRLAPSAGPWSALGDFHFVEFISGMFIAAIYRSVPARLPTAASALLVIAGSCLLVFGAIDGSRTMPQIYVWWPGATLIIFGCVMSDAAPQTSKFITLPLLLGDASYSLYLFHTMIGGVAWRATSFIVSPASIPYSYAAVVVMAEIAGAVMVHLAVERPVTRWLRNNLYRQPKLIPVSDPA